MIPVFVAAVCDRRIVDQRSTYGKASKKLLEFFSLPVSFRILDRGEELGGDLVSTASAQVG